MSASMPADSLWGGLAANYLGKAFTALLSLVTLPLLYRQMGSEAFGVFGLFYLLQAVLAVLDLGVGASVQRDLAAMGGDGPERADVIATLYRVEQLLWLATALAVLTAAAASPWVATAWLRAASLPHALVTEALVWVTVAASLQVVGGYYIGALNGLRLHRRANLLQAGAWALRFPLLLACVRPGFEAPGSMAAALVPVLQVWVGTNILLIAFARVQLARGLPPADAHGARPRLADAVRFGLPLVAATTLVMLFNQVDKLAATRLLALDALGRYTMMWSIAEVMYLVYQPVYTSFLPVFCARPSALREPVLLAWRIMAVLVLPVAAVLCGLPSQVILAWTGDAVLADTGAAPLRWMIAGSAVNAFLFIPFGLQQAAGDLRPWTWRIAVATAIYAPLAVGALAAWGMTGGAAAWCCGSVVLAAWLAQATRATLPELRSIAFGPATLPTLGLCVAATALLAVLPVPAGRIEAGALALAALAACAMAALVTQPDLRGLGVQALARLRSPKGAAG